MIQDIAPHIYHNEYKPKQPAKNSFGLSFEDGKLRVKMTNGELTFPTFEELEKNNPCMNVPVRVWELKILYPDYETKPPRYCER